MGWLKIITSENGPEIEWIRARDFYAPPDAVAADTVMIDGEPHYMMQVHPNSWLAEQWTEKEQAAMRLQERRPLAINKIAGNRKSSMTVGD